MTALSTRGKGPIIIKEGKKIEPIEKGTDGKVFLRLGTFDDSGVHEFVEVTPIVEKLNEIIDVVNSLRKRKRRSHQTLRCLKVKSRLSHIILPLH